MLSSSVDDDFKGFLSLGFVAEARQREGLECSWVFISCFKVSARSMYSFT